MKNKGLLTLLVVVHGITIPVAANPFKGSAATSGNKSAQTTVNSGTNAEQVPVIGQIGGATCGYHALENGILIANAMSNGTLPTLGEDFSEFLFGATGHWRRQVVEQRQKSLLTWFVLNDKRLQDHFLPEWMIQQPTSDTEFLVDIFRKMVAEKALALVSDPTCQSIMISCEDFCRQVVSMQSRNSLNQSRQNIVNAFATKQGREVYVRDNIKPFELKKDMLSNAFKTYNDFAKNKGAGQIFDYEGDWLSSAEIQFLVEYEQKNQCILADKGLGITILEDVYSDVAFLDSSFAVIREKLQTDANYRHVFVLGTMTHNKASGGGSAGHWFTMVVTPYKIYVADSSQNTDRRNDPRVHRVLQSLQFGAKKAQKPKASVSQQGNQENDQEVLLACMESGIQWLAENYKNVSSEEFISRAKYINHKLDELSDKSKADGLRDRLLIIAIRKDFVVNRS